MFADVTVEQKLEMVKLSESMIDQVIVACAKGGFCHRTGASEYRTRKEKEGWRQWNRLTIDEQEARKKDPLVECECVVLVDVGRKHRRPVADKNCCLCGGKRYRVMTAKELDALEYGIRKGHEQFARDERGEGCCALYVMESTDKMARDGVWHDPRRTDGWTLDYSTRKVPEQRVTITMPVKVYRGNALVEIVTKPVSVAVINNRCDVAWRPLLSMLFVQRQRLMIDVRDSVDEERIREFREDLFTVDKLISKLLTFGDAMNWRDDARRVLGCEFDKVVHLWA